jgi:hypothetical protein
MNLQQVQRKYGIPHYKITSLAKRGYLERDVDYTVEWDLHLRKWDIPEDRIPFIKEMVERHTGSYK